MARPRLVVTGSSGFVGRHLLDRLKERYEIVGIARRSQGRSGAPYHPNIEWHQVDIADREDLLAVFRAVAAKGPVETVFHLAAHYDFTGENDPEYWRTNVDGLRNVLDACRELRPRRFVFSSSQAACDFPAPGEALDEDAAPDGTHVYARTKALGERMLSEYADAFPSVVVRFAALFSDWCEYPPLFMFLQTWLSRAWNARVLGGKGRSAIPYLHVLDAVECLAAVLDSGEELEPGEVLNVSGDGAVSHLELFLAATQYWFGEFRDPIFLPKPFILPGVWVRVVLGRLRGELPFERPWMAAYVDRQLVVDSKRTRARLGWAPRERRDIIRRLPFLLENFKAEPVEWNRRNRAAMKQVRMRPNLRIHSLLGKHAARIGAEYTTALQSEARAGRLPSYGHVTPQDHEWNHRLVLRQLMNAVRTRERAVFLSYCRDLAERRFHQGFGADELCGALRVLDRVCIAALEDDADARDVLPYLHSHVTTTILFGCDQVQETFERLDARRRRAERAGRRTSSAEIPAPDLSGSGAPGDGEAGPPDP